MPSASPKKLEYIKAWRAANPDKVKSYRGKAKPSSVAAAREKVKQREQDDPEYRAKRQASRKRAWDKNKQKHRDKRRLEKYGITGDEYRRLLSEQGGKCWICDYAPEPDKDLSVDHDHVTGRVRGLLCNSCNLGLGNFRDNVSALKMAAKYLEVAGAR